MLTCSVVVATIWDERRWETVGRTQSAQDSKRTRVVIVCPCFVSIITVPGLDTELDDLTVPLYGSFHTVTLLAPSSKLDSFERRPVLSLHYCWNPVLLFLESRIEFRGRLCRGECVLRNWC